MRLGMIGLGKMQAYAEGIALMKGREDFGLDLARIAESWRRGSVVRSQFGGHDVRSADN